jgi:hypothetical protein
MEQMGAPFWRSRNVSVATVCRPTPETVALHVAIFAEAAVAIHTPLGFVLMIVTDRLKRFVTMSVVAEVNHLCQVPAIVRADGKRDEGWSCGLQAYLMGLALSADKFTCTVIVGRAFFIVGPSVNQTPVGLNVDPHAWLMIEDNGTLDVSPSFDQTDASLLREWHRTTIVRNRCIPSGRYVIAYSEEQYEQEIALASCANQQRTAIYFGGRHDEMNTLALQRAALIADSPLTEDLVLQYSDTVLFAAGRHIYDLAYGHTEPLLGLSRDRAWKALSKIRRDNQTWFLNRMKSTAIIQPR